MFQSVKATIIQGFRVASGSSEKDPSFNADGGTIRLQMVEFAKRGLDFNSYFDGDFVEGTLGLTVAPLSVKIKSPKYFFQGVRWTDKHDKPGAPPFVENFFLDPARIIFKGQTYKGLLYIPDPATKPGHFHLPTTIEVVAQKVPGISYGDDVVLEYNDAAIELA
jgi:hypothetical protein